MVFDRESLGEDFDFFQNGPVLLFLKHAVLDAAIEKLTELGYTVDEIRTASADTVYEDIGRAYDWQALFGYAPPNNLDALHDGVTEGNGPGRALVMRGFDGLHARAPDFARALVDMLADSANRNLLFGERLIVFLQVDDPRFQLKALGARDARWNGAEWLNSDRGL